MQLYNKYGGEGLEILAFPCNQFGGQEPGSNEQIKRSVPRCLRRRIDGSVSLTLTFSVPLIDGWMERARSFTRRYGVEFPVTEKADVNGPNAHPFFVYLKEKVSPAQDSSS